MTTTPTRTVEPSFTGSSRRSDVFDFLRLLAAVAVVVQHTNAELGADFAGGFFNLIDGVPMFFILSGFMVYQSAERIFERTGRWRQFFWNRYLRIAPAIYAFALLTPLVLIAVGAAPASTLISSQLVVWLAAAVFLAPNYDPAMWSHIGVGAMTWPLYTIPAEISFYVAIPVLVLVARRWGFWVMLTPLLVISVAASGAYLVLLPGGGIVPVLLSHTFLERGACFAVGVFWSRYWRRTPVSWIAFAAALAVYLWLKIWGFGWFYAAFKPLLLSIPLSYVIMVFGTRGPRFLSRLTKTIGDLSFSTYVWQYVVINVALFLGLRSTWWSAGAVLLATLGVAALSWRLVERPMLKLKRLSLRDGTTDDPVGSHRQLTRRP